MLPAVGHYSVDAALERARLTVAKKWQEHLRAYRDYCDRLPNHAVGAKSLGACPRWTGERTGRLLILHEGGFGDFFDYARYLRGARERCDRITMALHPALHALALRLLPIEEVCGAIVREYVPQLQTADAYSSSFLLLADALGARFGEPEPFHVTPILWSVRAGVPDEYHVGVCCTASEAARCIDVALLESLREMRGAWTFHSLAQDAAAPWIVRHSLDTWDDTVSLIAALDAVVTVDTAVAHLAACMRKPVHLLLPGPQDWRFGTEATTPWYPTMRIYRGNVGQSVERIARNLLRAADKSGAQTPRRAAS
jgi:hypothetical protein